MAWLPLCIMALSKTMKKSVQAPKAGGYVFESPTRHVKVLLGILVQLLSARAQLAPPPDSELTDWRMRWFARIQLSVARMGCPLFNRSGRGRAHRMSPGGGFLPRAVSSSSKERRCGVARRDSLALELEPMLASLTR